jgi:hypothetical protein
MRVFSVKCCNLLLFHVTECRFMKSCLVSIQNVFCVGVQKIMLWSLKTWVCIELNLGPKVTFRFQYPRELRSTSRPQLGILTFTGNAQDSWTSILNSCTVAYMAQTCNSSNMHKCSVYERMQSKRVMLWKTYFVHHIMFIWWYFAMTRHEKTKILSSPDQSKNQCYLKFPLGWIQRGSVSYFPLETWIMVLHWCCFLQIYSFFISALAEICHGFLWFSLCICPWILSLKTSL